MRNFDLLIPKREHPPTLKANEARRTRRLVARISKKITQRSTRKLVAVTLIQNSRFSSLNGSERRHKSQRNPKKTDSTVRESPKLRSSIRPAKSRRSWSPAWATRSSSGYARSLLNYNALIVLHIGKLHCLLHLQQMHAAVGKESTVEQG